MVAWAAASIVWAASPLPVATALSAIVSLTLAAKAVTIGKGETAQAMDAAIQATI